MRLTPRNFLWLLRRCLLSSFDDGCLASAKAAAYSALLSFFPVLASTATILVQTHAQVVLRTMENALREVVPPESADLVVQQFSVTGERPLTLLVVAGVISVWAASGVIKSLVDGFHAAYRVPRSRGFVHQTAVAMALVVASAVPLVFASLLIVFGTTVEQAVLNWLHVDRWNPVASVWEWVSRLARYAVAFAATVLITASLYYFGPYRKQQWRFVWPGAVLATGLWLIATSAFAWYTRNIAHYNVMYGSIGAGIALLVWMYVMAVIALIGCEFNAAYERSA